MVTSVSRLMGPTHPGRPETEEPHVKKSMKGKREKCDYICRIDQVRFPKFVCLFKHPMAGRAGNSWGWIRRPNTTFQGKLCTKMFLTSVFKMFDCDMDGVLNMMEAQHTLRCVGFRANAEQVGTYPSTPTTSPYVIYSGEVTCMSSGSWQNTFLPLIQRVPQPCRHAEDSGSYRELSSRCVLVSEEKLIDTTTDSLVHI